MVSFLLILIWCEKLQFTFGVESFPMVGQFDVQYIPNIPSIWMKSCTRSTARVIGVYESLLLSASRVEPTLPCFLRSLSLSAHNELNSFQYDPIVKLIFETSQATLYDTRAKRLPTHHFYAPTHPKYTHFR